MINLQALIPDSYPCVVEANTIEAIYIEEVQTDRNFVDTLVLKRYNTDKLIHLKGIGYNDKPTPETMSKASFAIQAARDGKPNEGAS